MKVNKVVCDICGADEAKTYNMPSLFFNKWLPKSIRVYDVDLCENCVQKATNLVYDDDGFKIKTNDSE